MADQPTFDISTFKPDLRNLHPIVAGTRQNLLSDQRMSGPRLNCFRVSVTPSLIDRAIAILERIVRWAECNSFVVSKTQPDSNLHLGMGETPWKRTEGCHFHSISLRSYEFPVRIQETYSERKEPDPSGRRTKRIRTPTGKLRLDVGIYVEDKGRKSVEQLLPAALERLPEIVAEWEAGAGARAAAEALRLAENEISKCLFNRRALEHLCDDDLMEEAKKFEEFARLRDYLKYLEKLRIDPSLRQKESEMLDLWLRWGALRLEKLDPALRRPRPWMDHRFRELIQPQDYRAED